MIFDYYFGRSRKVRGLTSENSTLEEYPMRHGEIQTGVKEPVSVVPSARRGIVAPVSRGAHPTSGIRRAEPGDVLRAPPPAWSMPSLQDYRVAGDSSLFILHLLPCKNIGKTKNCLKIFAEK